MCAYERADVPALSFLAMASASTGQRSRLP